MTKIKRSKIKIVSAKAFFDKVQGLYRFPFEPLDSRTDGSSLGRIMWRIELIKHPKKLDLQELYVWAQQTRDPRYAGKVFKIPVYAPRLTGSSLNKTDSFLGNVWSVFYCDVHGGVILDAYPQNQHIALRIEAMSSISIDVAFETGYPSKTL